MTHRRRELAPAIAVFASTHCGNGQQAPYPYTLADLQAPTRGRIDLFLRAPRRAPPSSHAAARGPRQAGASVEPRPRLAAGSLQTSPSPTAARDPTGGFQAGGAREARPERIFGSAFFARNF